jgi:hypothetical protein
MPDIFIDQAIKIGTENLYLTPSSIRIYPDQTIRYAARKTLKVACMMYFQQFPVDAQVCNLTIHSFAYTTDHYQLKFDSSSNYIDNKIYPAQFQYEVTYDDDFDMMEYDEVQPGLLFQFHFTRRLTSHVMQEFLPSFLLMMTAYGSLYLPPISINARGSTALITLLNIFTLNSGIRKIIPTHLPGHLVGGLDMLNLCIFYAYCHTRSRGRAHPSGRPKRAIKLDLTSQPPTHPPTHPHGNGL